jgi:hypothetical protein
MYLTDEEYENILQNIKDIVYKEGFIPYYSESDEIGNKYTKSNCGFCNEEFYPENHKYQQEHHVCPFDMRLYMTGNEIIDNEKALWGCFYHCYLFSAKREKDIDLMKAMVDYTIAHHEIRKKLFGTAPQK